MSDELTHAERESLEEMLQIAPFHRWLGLTIRSCSSEQLQLEMPWREEIVSNPMIGSAHGGVIASLIDLTGALRAVVAGRGCQGDSGFEGRLPSPCDIRAARGNRSGGENRKTDLRCRSARCRAGW